MDEFDGYDREALYKAIFDGKVTVESLPKNLYYKTANQLLRGVNTGFGKTLIELNYNTPDYKLLSELTDNIYFFSGAKTYHQVMEMKAAMVEDGKIIPFNDFRKKADETFVLYNETYLKTEYNTAIGQGQMASKWQDIESNKQLFPYLKYSAVIDGRTSEICKPLDGLVLPVDDKFWSKYLPLNHFGCRCHVIKLDKYTDESEISHKDVVKKAIEEIKPQMQSEFLMNAGKDAVIFSNKHPYFTEVPKKDKELAKKNFNLVIPKK